MPDPATPGPSPDGQGPGSLPAGTLRLFPNAEGADLDLGRWPGFLLSRLLEEGDTADLRWLTGALAEEEMAVWLARCGRRQLSRRSRAFWELLLDAPSLASPGEIHELWPL